MAYLKPPSFVSSVFNKLAMQLGMYGVATLSVRGRTTGKVQEIPVIPVELEGVRHVVSTRGESEWVRNLRASGECELRRKGKTERLRATELPVAERSAVLEAYRAKAGKMVDTYWNKLPDPADHPVFKLASAS